MHELPLVFFTLLGQLGAGLIFCAGFYQFFIPQHIENIYKTAIEKIQFTALITMAVAMLLASFHLGKPLRAFNVIYGIGRSPMSNEIFTFGILFGFTFVCVLINYFRHSDCGNRFPVLKKRCLKISGRPYFSQAMGLCSMMLSLLFVWTIVATYTLPTVQTWNTAYTPLQMYSAMFVLGGIAASLFGLHYIGNLFFIISAIVVLLSKIPYYNLMSSLASHLASDQLIWMISESLLLLFALSMVIILGWRASKSTAIYITAFVLVFAGELCGRIAFYYLWIIGM